jgi:hypothetical protein
VPQGFLRPFRVEILALATLALPGPLPAFRRAEFGRGRHLPPRLPEAGPAGDIAAAFLALAFGCDLHSDLGEEGGIGVAFVELSFAGGAAAPEPLAGKRAAAALAGDEDATARPVEGLARLAAAAFQQGAVVERSDLEPRRPGDDPPAVVSEQVSARGAALGSRFGEARFGGSERILVGCVRWPYDSQTAAGSPISRSDRSHRREDRPCSGSIYTAERKLRTPSCVKVRR